MKSEITGLIEKSVQKYLASKNLAPAEKVDFDITIPKDPAHGELSTNAAFKLSKWLAPAKPFAIAKELIGFLEQESAGAPKKIISKMEVAGGAYINFFLTQSWLGDVLKEAHQKDRAYGHSDFGKGQKVLIEFVSANPTGPLTIAHGRQAAVGDSLARILKATGHQVQKEYYLNDAGRQMNLLGASLYARYSQALGKDLPLPEDGYQGEYLKEIAAELIVQKKDSLLRDDPKKAADFCRQYAGDLIMQGIRKDQDSIGVAFDAYFNETALYQNQEVEKTLKFLASKGLIYEQEGALWFRTTDFGDDKDRVLKKSTGEYTYFTPDIAYHHYKFSRGFVKLVNLLGPDHHGYVPRLKAACQALGHNAEDLNILIVQLTRLFRNGQQVRMSTRAGEFVTLKELVDEVGADAARFFFVMRRIESPLDFDLDLAKKQSPDNPVFYLQYAHARIASLLRFAERPVTAKADVNLLSNNEERDVIRQINEFSTALVQASTLLEPYRLVDYLRDLATAFHKFYSLHRIVTEDAALSDARLLLAEATRIVLRNGLELLGVSQPESM